MQWITFPAVGKMSDSVESRIEEEQLLKTAQKLSEVKLKRSASSEFVVLALSHLGLLIIKLLSGLMLVGSPT